jgi:hypothetical protein
MEQLYMSVKTMILEPTQQAPTVPKQDLKAFTFL